MADLQVILSSGDITGVQFDSVASGDAVLVTDEIEAKDTIVLSDATAYADGLLLTPPTTVNAATYRVLTTDQILHVTYPTTGACTIELYDSILIDGFHIVIKDASGNAATNNITLDAGEAFIDGEASQVITGNYDAINIYSDGTNFYIY